MTSRFGMKRFRVALPQKQLNGDPYLWRLLPGEWVANPVRSVLSVTA
jgi:hypothetical protein